MRRGTQSDHWPPSPVSSSSYHYASLLFLKVPSMVLPQGFCTGHSFHLDSTSPRNQPSLLPKVTFSVILPTNYLKPQLFPFILPHTLEISSYVSFAPSHLSPPILLFVFFSYQTVSSFKTDFFQFILFTVKNPSSPYLENNLVQWRCLINERLNDQM